MSVVRGFNDVVHHDEIKPLTLNQSTNAYSGEKLRPWLLCRKRSQIVICLWPINDIFRPFWSGPICFLHTICLEIIDPTHTVKVTTVLVSLIVYGQDKYMPLMHSAFRWVIMAKAAGMAVISVHSICGHVCAYWCRWEEKRVTWPSLYYRLNYCRKTDIRA
jgi:hypothetical protein